jgi:hypothetical protein
MSASGGLYETSAISLANRQNPTEIVDLKQAAVIPRWAITGGDHRCWASAG